MTRIWLLAILLLVGLAQPFTLPVSAQSNPKTDIFGISASPDGELLVMSSAHGIHIYRLSTGAIVCLLEDELKNYGQGTHANIAWSPDGTNLAVGMPSKGVRIWDVAACEILAEQPPHLEDYDNPGFAWSPDGSQLAVGTGNRAGEILVWDKETNTWDSLTAYTGQQVSLVWTADDELLVMGAQALYDAYTGEFVRDFFTPIDGASGYALWSPDTTLAYVFFDLGGSLRNSETNTSEGFGACCYAEVAWSMDGHYFAAASFGDNEIWVWDTQSDEVVVQERQGDVIYAFAWLPNDELLAAGSMNGEDVIWNATTGEVLFNP